MMGNYSFESATGLTVEASAAAISFLWTHWDVCDQLNHGAVKIRCLSADSWSGRGWGGAAEWHLVRSSFGVDQGEFEFLAFGRFLWATFRSQVTCGYRRVGEGILSYQGKGKVVFTSRIAPLARLIEIYGPRGSSYVNQVGGRLAELITKHPTLVREKAGDIAWHTYQEFMNEEAAIKAGVSCSLRHFTEGGIASGKAQKETEVDVLRAKLADLERRISAISAEINIKDYYSSLLVFASDPAMALVKNRTIVEHIAKVVFVRELRQPSGKRMLSEIVDCLAKQSRNVPANILALMRTVGHLGNVGGHVEDVGVARSSINTCEFSVSFSATLRITEWLCSDYSTRTNPEAPCSVPQKA